MKARIQRTNSKTTTHVLTLTVNPLEAEKILEDLETADGSSYASKLMFIYMVSIADMDRRLQDRINMSDAEDVEGLWAAWRRRREEEATHAEEQPTTQA